MSRRRYVTANRSYDGAAHANIVNGKTYGRIQYASHTALHSYLLANRLLHIDFHGQICSVKRNWVHVHRPGRIGPPGASQPESDDDSGGDSGDEDSDFALRLGVYADQDERLSSLRSTKRPAEVAEQAVSSKRPAEAK